MKPILFNTDMVLAILENRKTVTRREVKLKYSNTHLEMFTNKYGTRLIEKQNEEPGVTTIKNPDGTTTHKLLACIEKEPPYRPGDILYVREKWRIVDYLDGLSLKFEYEADGKISDFIDFTNDRLKKFLKYIGRKGWCPKIFMPREAARIFLRVKDVRVERLQDIKPEQLRAEGFHLSFTPSECQRMFDRWGAVQDFEREREKFASLWDSTIKKSYRALYGWAANPWVWVIEFERISREKAVNHAI